MSTKGLSSLLSAGNPFDIIRYWITYPLAIVLAGTAVIQITYLNRALQRFDSREVIPTQFVLFTLSGTYLLARAADVLLVTLTYLSLLLSSAIIGSAVLYRDFENVDAHRLLNFFFGCLMTFAGVILLTRGGASQEKSRKGRSSRPGHRITSSGSSQEDRDSSATAESGEEEAHLSEDADTLGPSTPKRTRRARPTPGTATTTGSVPLAQSASPLAALRTPRMSLIGLATSPRLGGGLLTPSAGSERLSVGPAGLSAGHYLLLAASPPVAIPEDRLRPGLRAPGSYSRTRSLSQPPTPRRRRAAVAGAGTNRRGDGSPARRRGADADLEAGQGMLGHGRSDDDSGIESDMEGRGDTDQSGGASVPNESTPLVSSSAPQAGRRNGARTRDSAQTSAR